MNKFECNTYEDWSAMHEEVFPGLKPPNSIKGIRQRIQRYEGINNNREPMDYSFDQSERLVAGEIDLLSISPSAISASNIVRGSKAVTEIKLFDQRVQLIRERLRENPVPQAAEGGTLYQNGHK